MKEELFENSGDLKYLSLQAEEKFEKYLSEEQAVKLAEEAYQAAQKVDALLEPVLNDPELHEQYDYDGMHFTSKNKNRAGALLICDGKNILRIVKENATAYFYGRSKEEAIGNLKKIFKDYVLLAKSAAAYWQKNKDFSLEIDMEKLRKIFAKSQAEDRPQPITEEEASFFENYEKEMKQYEEGETKPNTTD